jgi:mannose-1-phosphate guanylyltransferase
MDAYRQPWALVLAAGEGSRLSALTTDRQGNSIPKQFCSLNGGATLLQLALHRATRVARWERIATIVAAQHEVWWRNELAFAPEANVIVQSHNRGTAIGVLQPLLCILARDPEARIILFPSDHFVADEEVLARSAREALAEVHRRPDRLVLLGIVPDEPDGEFGWIIPSIHGEGGVQEVQRFVEKPSPPVAAGLMRDGGVWNSFILAATGKTLLELFDRKLPDAVTELWGAVAEDPAGVARPEALARAYEKLGSHDFCGEVLEGCEDRLSVLPVPRCGWSDLGTPARVARCIEQLTPCASPPAQLGVAPIAVNLAQVSFQLAQASRA